MWGKDSELEGGHKNLSNRVVRAQRLSVMYWLKNSLCSTAVAAWAWWRACVLTGCRSGEKLSWRGEGHRCTQWEGVSQNAGSAALPTRTWPEKKERVSLHESWVAETDTHWPINHCSLVQDSQHRQFISTPIIPPAEPSVATDCN